MRLVSGLLLTAIAAPLAAATLPPPPVFPTGTTTDTFYGIPVADPYRALESADDPKVQAWSDAQNDRTRAYLDQLGMDTAAAAR